MTSQGSTTILDEALSRLLASKSVPPKETRPRTLQHRASEGTCGFYSRIPSPHGEEPTTPISAPQLDRASSDQRCRLLREEQSEPAPPAVLLRSSNSDGGERAAKGFESSGAESHSGDLGQPAGVSQDESTGLAASSSSASLPQSDVKERVALWSTAPVNGSTVAAASPERVRQEGDDEEEQPSFFDYLHRELNPAPLYPTTDAVWGQTERQRVYNAIAYVPYQLERLVWFGTLLCSDSFLGVFTVLPVRFLRALRSMTAFDQHGKHRRLKLQGQQLMDLLCVAMFATTFLFLRSLDAGAIYFWMKDLTQEFLKLQVIYTAVEMFDKITCSFAVDSLEALSGTCTLFTSSPNKGNHLGHLLSDFTVTLCLMVLHGMILMCQGMAFSVAMNSKRNHALVALIIATNFVEIKGTIFKRFDTTKLFVMTCQDVVERFHLCLSLLFVVAEEMDNSSRWVPNPSLALKCAQIFGAEICIDVIKHAVLGKFNEIRPGVYREFTRDVCDKVITSHSHNNHRIVCFEPFGPAAFFLRIVSAMVVSKDKKLLDVNAGRILLQGSLCILGWLLLCGAKVLLGFWLKGAANAYLRHFDKRQKKTAHRPPLARAAAAGNISKIAKIE